MPNSRHPTGLLVGAGGLLLVGLWCSLLMASRQANLNEQAAAIRFQALDATVQEHLMERITRYQYGLRGARGAIMTVGPDRIDRATFRAYHESRNIKLEFDGARGFGFIRRVPASEVEPFLRQARLDGMPDFQIRQLAPHAGDRYVIQYIEPVADNRAAVGLDIASELHRRTAAEQAMRTGKVTLSAPITLSQAPHSGQRSFLLLLPIYRMGMPVATAAQREAATYGWSYAPLVIDEVLSDIGLDKRDFSLALFDASVAGEPEQFFGSPRPLFADSAPSGVAAAANEAGALVNRSRREVFGRTWLVETRASEHFVSSLGLTEPRLVFAAGAATSVLLATLAYVYCLGRHRRRLLWAQQVRLATVIQNASDAIIGQSFDGTVLSWNHAAERIFGFRETDAVGRPIETLILAHQAQALEARIRREVQQGMTVPPFDTVCTRRDGMLVDVSITAAPITSSSGEIVGIGKTIRDISDSKAAERQLREFNTLLEQQVQQRTLEQEAASRHLQALLDGLPSMVGYWDKDLFNRFANHAYRKWFGADAVVLPGMNLRDLLSPDLFERNRRYIEGALRGELQTFERAIQRPDADRIRYSLAHYIPDIVEGEVRGFYVLVHDVTELTESRHELAAALRESESLLQTIQMHSVYSVTNAAGDIIDVNDAFCRLSGYERAELIGQNHRVVNSGEHPTQFWSHMWNTIALGHSWHGEVCNRAKDGSLYWVDSIIAPFVGPQGEIDKYVSLCTDVTAARLATQSLAQERERLENILTGTNVGTWEWNVQTGEARFNERWAQIIGHTLADLAPVDIRTWIDQVHPDDLQRSNERLSRHFSGDEPYYECETRMRHKDGHWIWALDRGRVLSWDENNEPLLMSGTHLDITERKLAEERLRAASEAFLERVGVVAGVGGWEVTLASGEVIMTTQTRRIHELPEQQSLSLEEMLGHFAAQAQPLIRSAVQKAIEHCQGWDLELPFVTATGRDIWVRIVGEAEQEGQGMACRTTRLIGALQDVSAKHAAEDALRAAKLVAEAASLAKSEFLANMSHEIRTPMNAVIGLAYLLDETRLNGEQRQFVTKIQAAGRSLLGVINNVLDLSKIEAGELTIEQAPFRLSTVIQDMRELFGEHAGTKAIHFHVRTEPQLPECLIGDVQRLRQVLINLLGNAFKFTDDGEVTLDVSATDRDEEHIVLRCAVKDTGLGISPDVQAKLFTPFMQADASTTRRFGGTGLGLSIVRRLVALMGGAVGVHSREGVGSEFWFTLPLAIAGDDVLPHNEEVSEVQALQGLGAKGAFWLHGVRVLVVDDSDINREVAQKILSREGATVELARDGHEALSKLRDAATPFDAVLMDVQMPLMDGHEATRRIRSQPGLETLPVIALTAGALVSERARAYESGMTDFVSKPFDPKALVHALRRHVERRSGQALPVVPRLAHDDDDQWPVVAGIDAVSASDKLGGDVRLFAAMLDRLLTEFADIGEVGLPEDPIKQRVLAGRLHKLRGSSGMLGAAAIHGLAEQAEKSFQLGQVGPELGQIIRQLGVALGELRQASANLRNTLIAPDADASASDESVLGDAERNLLIKQLQSNDLAAVTTFQALSAALFHALGQERGERLRVAVMSLAFEEAQRVLAEA